MNKRVVLLGLALVALSTVQVQVAQASFRDDFKATLGIKTWYNSWEETDEQSGGSSRSSDFGSSLMMGPSLTLRYKKAFLGASYLLPLTNYEFDEPGYTALEYERKDLDIIAGVMFVPSFGIFAGYKSIDAPISSPDSTLFHGNRSVDGFGVGVLGNIPLGRSAAIYGNLAGMLMHKDFSSSTYIVNNTIYPARQFDFDMYGASAELGVAVAFNPMFSMSLGLKGQYFSGNDKNDYNHTSTFLGPTLGLNATF